ncbi:protein phosphatase CheZ [Sphaerotilus sp.]|uniref:protein phosphatase CheZ n=1 Tax=Sphaerotilus sp. TaxID=2093942 RepID=UPI002ACE26A3|nr:protein phosphatase CheZ [Sphaerotilus sp.]MDZ7856714.1 protein phosphatase CheZ [Sphaerotilus sp.]MDZ7857616.1 protein phosphatase CheZ [Sphaerotilus sp.]
MTDQQTHYASPEVIRQIGELTRKLHDSIAQMGLMGDLQAATQALPDARSRLNYIARKTSEAAEKVLNSVDAAKLEQRSISDAAESMRKELASQPHQDAAATQRLLASIAQAKGSTDRIDDHLTNIMVAQDFHDLTGQIVSKVVKLTGELEQNLIQLLLQVAPEYKALATVHEEDLHGPVVDPGNRTDVVNDQNEVDDLLARMGF